MSNSFFKFKQFTIHQHDCAMKVTTDACLQGAWTPIIPEVKRVLDAGTGTGLLSLMIRQRAVDAKIDALEIDEEAYKLAWQNINATTFAGSIQVIHGDVRTLLETLTYDLIICNPPFFDKSLLGPNNKRNAVRHTLTFSYTDICNMICKHLSFNGYASVLLPYQELGTWNELLKDSRLYLNRILLIRPRAGKEINRFIALCSKQESGLQEEELVIYNADNSYTQNAINLLKPYYLNL
jgi:tRNA1Val (adenine37-N6)-methyltransferase